jgi:hypothetical protein
MGFGAGVGNMEGMEACLFSFMIRIFFFFFNFSNGLMGFGTRVVELKHVQNSGF